MISEKESDITKEISKFEQEQPSEKDNLRQEVSKLRQEIDNLKEIVKSSIRNEGVQTDIRQTIARQDLNKQVDMLGTTKESIQKVLTTTNKINASDVISVVNDFKTNLRKKVKSLTDKEFFIFSLIYTLEEQLGAVSYKSISLEAGISESAVRDYIRGLFKKEMPLTREKANNKIVMLNISPELKSMVSLESLIKMRSFSEKVHQKQLTLDNCLLRENKLIIP